MNKMIWRDVLHVMSKVEACLLIGKGNAKFCLLNIHIYLFEWVYCLILLITQQQYTVVHLKIFFRSNAWTKKSDLNRLILLHVKYGAIYPSWQWATAVPGFTLYIQLYVHLLVPLMWNGWVLNNWRNTKKKKFSLKWI